MQRFVTSNLWVAPKEKKIRREPERLFSYAVKMECSINLKATVPNKRQEGTLIFRLQPGQRFQKENENETKLPLHVSRHKLQCFLAFKTTSNTDSADFY